MSATIKDVAKEAGVSVGTVSRYLNGQQLKSANMNAVKNAIEKLDYKENIIAKGMKNNITKSVGVVINTLADVFASGIVTAIESVLEANNYSMVICDYQENMEKLERKLKFLQSRNVDAIIVFHVEENLEVLDELRNARIPVLAIDCPIKGGQNDTIIIDNRKASYDILQYLYDQNHKDIGIIAGNPQHFTGNQRYKGCLSFYEDHQMQMNEKYVYYGNYQIIDGYQATNYFLSLNPRPTAIYATNYYMTIGAIQALNEKGLKIPEDISLVGFDYLDIFNVFKYDITMVEQPLEEIGKKAAQMILERMWEKKGNDDPQFVVVPTKIHHGNSITKKK